jgi:hypothetical protein
MKTRRYSLIRYCRVYWVIEDAVISCIWCRVEDRIRQNVFRYFARWIRESVTVVQPFSGVGVTFVPLCVEMFAIETLRKHLCYFLTSVLRAYRLCTHIGLDDGRTAAPQTKPRRFDKARTQEKLRKSYCSRVSFFLRCSRQKSDSVPPRTSRRTSFF